MATAGLDRRILDLVMAAMADLDEGRRIWPRVFLEMSGRFELQMGGLIDYDRATQQVHTIAGWPDRVHQIKLTPAENGAYPLLRHYGQRKDPVPRTLDDVIDVYRWRASARFARMREQFAGADTHLMMPLRRTGSTVRLLGLCRPGGNFTACEQRHIRRLQPVLEALDRHEQTITRWRTRHADHASQVDKTVTDLGITPREVVILTLLAEGLTATSAGRRLGISPRTVAKHQQNLQRKLATVDRVNTVLRAQRLGLVPDPAAAPKH
jgi:DNA-binding CsgD family transcriptional regulator